MKIKGQEITQEIIDRLESKIFIVTEGEHKGCHEITYAKDGGGYYRFKVKGKNVSAHRLMYQIHHPDEDIDAKQICHRCDNPGCVVPEHLFSGTTQENTADKVNKGRQQKGSDVVISKLIESEIVEMMNLTLSGHFTSYEAIAEHYDITKVNVGLIINQKTWKHITKDFDMAKVKSLLDNHFGSKHPTAAFNNDQVRDVQLRLKNGESQQNIANFYNVRQGTISNISTGKSYQDVV